MDPRLTTPPLRHMVQLDDKNAGILQSYLHRSTVLWNLLLTHSRHQAKSYLAGEASEDNDVMISEWILSLAISLTKVKEGAPTPAWVTESWRGYLPTVCELSDTLILNRANDLIDSYIMAKNYVGKPGSQSDPPGLKNEHSSQSIRLGDNDFCLKDGNLLTFQVLDDFGPDASINSIVIDVTDWTKLHQACQNHPNYLKQSTLAITRRRRQQEEGNFGPTDNSYILSLRKDYPV